MFFRSYKPNRRNNLLLALLQNLRNNGIDGKNLIAALLTVCCLARATRNILCLLQDYLLIENMFLIIQLHLTKVNR